MREAMRSLKDNAEQIAVKAQVCALFSFPTCFPGLFLFLPLDATAPGPCFCHSAQCHAAYAKPLQLTSACSPSPVLVPPLFVTD